MDSNRVVNYDRVAPAYDRRYAENDYSGIYEALFEFVSGVPGGDILEVGCGTGHWLDLLSQWDYNVTGLDPSRGMLDLAGNKSIRARLVQGQAEALPFRDESFDRLYCINAIQHFTEKEVFMREACRVLRPKGAIMIVGLDPHAGLDRWWIYDYFPRAVEIDRRRYAAASQIQEMLCLSGFVDGRTIEVLHMPVRMAARDALEKGLLARASTSQLIVLTDDEYDQGMNNLKRDIEAADAGGCPLNISADLHVYATTGWVGKGSG